MGEPWTAQHQTELGDPEWVPLPTRKLEGYPCSYLHTLSFADPEPSYEEARARWNNFGKWLERTRKWGVCVPEWGRKTGRIHFHLVTAERWEVAELREVLPKYGFGKVYDVRERPWSSACYAAKYVSKSDGRPDGMKGIRLWSVFGKKWFPHGVSRASDCEMTTKKLYVVAEAPQTFADWLDVRLGADNETLSFKLRPDALPDGPRRMNEINTAQLKVVSVLLTKGGFVGVGEYRSCVATEREMSDFKDKSKKVRWVFVEHRVEFAGDQKIIEERMPAGFDIKAVTPPAASGDMVAFVAKSSNTFNGATKWKGELHRLTESKPVAKGAA